MRRLLHSQLFHFFVLGALVFAAYAVINDEPDRPSADTIELTEARADSLVENFSAVWNRPPTATELEKLMQAWVLEEAYVREALALGLDRGDAVIRQRLTQKMRFLAESSAAAQEPADAVLQSFLETHSDRFMQPARMAFEQIALPSDRVASEVLALLNAGADPSTLAPASLLPPSFPMSPVEVIDRTFGAGFHEELAELPVGEWQGPVRSGYGDPLVRVSGSAPAVLPTLADIRDRVQAEWRASEMTRIGESFAEALMKRYTVRLPDVDEVLRR